MTQAPTSTTPTQPATTTGGGSRQRPARPALAHPRRRGREPQPVGRERRPADIGKAFDASQTALDLIAVGYSLGLAASVLWLGAVGDRYGRKLMLILGMVLSVPACLLAAFAPSDQVLFVARMLGGCRPAWPTRPRWR